MNWYNRDKKKWAEDFEKPFRLDLKLFYDKWSKNDSILFHGSNLPILKELLPYKANCVVNADGNLTAVYATNDIHLAIYYAILDKGLWKGYSISEKFTYDNEGCYFFALEESILESNPFRNGYIYVTHRKKFTQIISDEGATFEWFSNNPEIIIDSIEVCPDDFKFLNKITIIEESHFSRHE